MYNQIKGLRRHLNAELATKTKLAFAEHATTSGICSTCAREGMCEIGYKARTGRTLFPEPFGTHQFGAEKRIPGLEEIQILPELFGKGQFFNNVKTEVKIGSFECSLPIAVAAIGSTKVASDIAVEISKGAALAGIPRVIGENVLATFGKEGLKKMIQSFLDNYKDKGAIIVQANFHDQKMKVPEIAVELGAHAVELKFGQGAKQNLGGEIKFERKEDVEKYKKYGYLVVENQDNTYQRHSFPGDITEESLRETLIRYSALDVPIWIKISVGRDIVKFIELCNDIKRKENIPLECITVDGHGGGTGMSPWLIMEETNMPSIIILQHIQKIKPKFDVLVAGGFTNGVDVAKAMMMGASGVAMGRAMIIAASVAKENGILNFTKAIREELQMISTVLRCDNVNKIKNKRENLIALSKDAAELFGLRTTI
ncbi:MAG: alpha-hydroxy-acid oxidizing protein [Candidatus Parvarchaeota archaeon]|nr:alpha-hydroxy-acid oxidizing protein [Candidatus Jingweiarchaeum tengchongense]MCW1298215.1 alpha-hydroxy-acid oxidizing protein [Candidatus Jingweiarchaeum tengchongense]MCW1300013.1 alpha-hydroxy-acid oxidizing protein [Candidatus Jingweiarchaeum tengchongense]MCW1304848.1 alpha-hydroxy-acid oxidizing protein [Candidatus Jingweiarchaeum tengchongense]MCW1305438.1 alpha-hydroxy-acid oxidizing protein [Candidatus Jingweiarchaeum tengchongense]